MIRRSWKRERTSKRASKYAAKRGLSPSLLLSSFQALNFSSYSYRTQLARTTDGRGLRTIVRRAARALAYPPDSDKERTARRGSPRGLSAVRLWPFASVGRSFFASKTDTGSDMKPLGEEGTKQSRCQPEATPSAARRQIGVSILGKWPVARSAMMASAVTRER